MGWNPVAFACEAHAGEFSEWRFGLGRLCLKGNSLIQRWRKFAGTGFKWTAPSTELSGSGPGAPRKPLNDSMCELPWRGMDALREPMRSRPSLGEALGSC